MVARKVVLRAVVVLTALVGAVSALVAVEEGSTTEPKVPADVRTALQDRRYDDAVRSLDRLITAETESPDYWLYLKGLAQSYAGRHAEAAASVSGYQRAVRQADQY